MTASTPYETLIEIDRYIERLCAPCSDEFELALRDATTAGLPDIHVSRNEGKLLYLLAKICGARRILEIGLLGGYSALWLASALPVDGTLVTLEIDEQYARVARKNLERAGLASKVEVRVGDARATLDKMVRAAEPLYDFVFIDADKQSYPVYLQYALSLTGAGALIVADNVIREGRVVNDEETDPGVRAIQEFNRQLASHPELEAILVPVMRHKLDGLAIARRR